jgi:pimeloyl-ACP methyl ester carboxylesterase
MGVWLMPKTILKNNQTLSYMDFGNKAGYPVLIQHGLIASITDTALFEPLCQLGLRLISIARPGYGESSPYLMKDVAEWGEIVLALVDGLKLSCFDVLGISSGAPYSYALGYKFPQRVRNIFVLSGTPALFDAQVQAHWPYEIDRQAEIPDLQKLAYDLFFSALSPDDLQKQDILDSMQNNCFGLAQDFKIRCVNWGFSLSDVKQPVMMQHSRADKAVPLDTAEITASLLPNCHLEIRENDPHFSEAVLKDFVNRVMVSNLKNKE